MKHVILLAVLFTWVEVIRADDLQQNFEKAYFLETAKAQTQEALAIYGRIVQAEATDETRPVIIRSLERMLALHKRQRDRTFQDKMDHFDWYPDDRARVVDVFGEPESYQWLNRIYTKDNLPRSYDMQYPDGPDVSILGGKISCVSIKNPSYQFHGLSIGCSLDEVLAVFSPQRIVEWEKTQKTTEVGVLYKNYISEGTHSYNAGDGFSFFFTNDKLYSISFRAPFSITTPPASTATEPK